MKRQVGGVSVKYQVAQCNYNVKIAQKAFLASTQTDTLQSDMNAFHVWNPDPIYFIFLYIGQLNV